MITLEGSRMGTQDVPADPRTTIVRDKVLEGARFKVEPHPWEVEMDA